MKGTDSGLVWSYDEETHVVEFEDPGTGQIFGGYIFPGSRGRAKNPMRDWLLVHTAVADHLLNFEKHFFQELCSRNLMENRWRNLTVTSYKSKLWRDWRGEGEVGPDLLKSNMKFSTCCNSCPNYDPTPEKEYKKMSSRIYSRLEKHDEEMVNFYVHKDLDLHDYVVRSHPVLYLKREAQGWDRDKLAALADRAPDLSDDEWQEECLELLYEHYGGFPWKLWEAYK